MVIQSPFLLSLRDVIRVKRYSLQTAKSYLYQINLVHLHFNFQQSMGSTILIALCYVLTLPFIVVGNSLFIKKSFLFLDRYYFFLT